MLQERILVGGTPGSGKTYAWLTIANACPENKFYVIDPDDGVRRVWYKDFPDVKNVEYYSTPHWFTKDFETFNVKGATFEKLDDGSDRHNIYKSGVADAWKLIKPKLKPGDWVIVEHLHLLWSMVQDAFADEVFDRSIGQYFLQKRKAMKEGSKKLEALEGWTDWNVINKLHNDDFTIDICFDNPAHVFMTTSMTTSSGGKEDNQIKNFYGDSDLRYEGQKHNVFRVQTTLITKLAGRGKERKFIINTFQKDRGREFLEEYEWSDFYIEYLVAVAGW
jgi:hypothetical protein